MREIGRTKFRPFCFEVSQVLNEVLQELKSLGTEQNRKIYINHGAGENVFGVSFANLEKIRKRIKKNHTVTQQLWNTGNVDAQSLATMITDAQGMSKDELNDWLALIKYYAIVDLFVRYTVSKSQFFKLLSEEWLRNEDEWVGRAGWVGMSILAMQDKTLSDEYFLHYLSLIQTQIHQSKNRKKESMNMALIAIGIRNPNLESFAISVAKKIGVVEVNQGNTSCKTPDAIVYIQKTALRKKK